VGDIYAFQYTGDPLYAIPLAERFFGGGGSSHRGFPENQAGPRDANTGFPLGGTALLFNQTELRFPLVGDNMGGVIFHDAGNIYSSLSNFSLRQRQRGQGDFDYMVHAAGFGIRYRTPVGPLRVDLGYSINGPSYFGFKGTQQDLLIAGKDPCLTSNKCQEQRVSHFQYFFSIGQTF
jgi:outer membrane protein assembly factor BamA